MKFRRIIFTLALICLPALVFSQPILPGDSTIVSGIHQLYNFQHKQAVETFRKVIADYPKHPAGYVLLGVARWEYIRGTQGIPPSEDTLLTEMNRAAELAKIYTTSHPRDPYGWLVYGMALGIQSRVDLARSHWVKAAIHGYKGIQQIKHAQALAPNLPDLQIALGAFHYYLELSSPLLKFAAGIIGFSGNQHQGKTELLIAATRGRYVWPEANNILTYIDGYLEDSVSTALRYSDTMIRDFPESPYIWMIRADMEYTIGDTVSGNTALNRVQHLLPTLDKFYKQEYHKRLVYLKGIRAFYRHHYQDSIELLKQYLNFDFGEYDVNEDNSELIIGKSYLALGDREKAQNWLEKVLHRDIPTRMQSEARQILDEMK